MPSQSFQTFLSELESDPIERAALDLARARVALGRQVRQRREAAGLTQRALAHEAGVRQADVSRIEAAKANPTVETLTKLGSRLGVTLTFQDVPSAA